MNGPSGNQPKSRDSYAGMWYDGIGRRTETANYGTNEGTEPNRPTSAPPSSDTILATETIYNADGEMEDTIDPAGKKDRIEYDDAGRITKVTANYASTPVEVTTNEYNADGKVSKLIAENADTGNQETSYTYGVTLTNSKIASNDVLRKITYPDSGEVLYEYNRQNDTIEMTDQNGSTHTYEYDKLGRRIENKVTPGTGVDNSVLRIQTTWRAPQKLIHVL